MTLLSKTECSALRGIAIIGIFLHNYIHWLPKMPKENEYIFTPSHVDSFFTSLTSCTDSIGVSVSSISSLFSFFGHYGVPIFLFLSGYGLVHKYESPTASSMSKLTFISSHFKKLFPMMILGFVLYVIVDIMTPPHANWTWQIIIENLTMTANLFPKPSENICPGPYWYFSLMMQLYIIYILIFHKRSNYWIYGAILLCFALQLCYIGNTEGEILERIRYNCIGAILPFGIGILIARYENVVRVKKCIEKLFTPISACGMAIGSLSIVFLGSLNFVSWLLVPAFIVTLNVGVIKLLNDRGLVFFDCLGAISSAIFVCHPITRKIFIPMARHGEVLYGLVLYIIATILLAIVFRAAFRLFRRILG